MKNAETLREELAEVFDKLKSGDMPPKTAKEMINSVGKMTGLVKVQLEYAAMRNVKPEIKFLDCN